MRWSRLPARLMRPRWTRDSRSWGLQFSAGVCLSRALAYFPRTNEELPTGLAGVAHVIPVWVYGAMWGATALGLMVVAIWGKRTTPMQAAALVVVPSLWASLYLAGALANQSIKALSAAYLFWCFIGMMVAFLISRPSDSWGRGHT